MPIESETGHRAGIQRGKFPAKLADGPQPWVAIADASKNRDAIKRAVVERNFDKIWLINRSAMTLQLYGIPTCGTCKKAFQWLHGKGIDYEFINTKDHPPSRDTIASWVTTLGSQPMRNTSGQSYRALGDEKKTWTEEQWIEAFAADPMLIKRPLIVQNGTAIMVGFRVDEESIRQRLGLVDL